MNTQPATPDSLTPTTPPDDQRLVVVSNRLPVTVKQNANGEDEFKESSGGLATGMSGVKRETDMLWYGWPGIELPNIDAEARVTQKLRRHHSAVPVFLEENFAEMYYNGFSSMFFQERSTVDKN